MPKSRHKPLSVPRVQTDASHRLKDYVNSLEEEAQEKLNQCLPFIMNEFRKSFITEFIAFKKEVHNLANGNVANIDGWKDKITEFSIGTGSVMAGAIIAALSALGLIGIAITTGVGIAVAVVGLAVGIGYGIYKNRRDKKEYQRADALFQREHLDEDVKRIADSLAKLYASQLVQCTPKDAAYLAKSCVKAITHNMLKNKHMRFDELLHPVLLQGMLMKSASTIPNIELQLITANTQKIKTRDVIQRSALYCRENDKFYSSPSSDPRKYGLLFFKTKKEVNEYALMIEKMHKKHPQKWHFAKMQPAQSHMLKNDAFFKVMDADSSDEVFTDSEKSSSGELKF